MLKQRYMLVLADATGRPLRRFKVTPRALTGLAVTSGVLMLAMLAVLGHLWMLREQSSLAKSVRDENAALARLTQRLENRLPTTQKLARTTEATFDQVWSKSALGRDPTLLPEHVALGHGGHENSPQPGDRHDDRPSELEAAMAQRAKQHGTEHGASHAEAAGDDTLPLRAAEDFASAQDFAALPDNLDNLEHHILRLQGTLGETLEYYHDAAQLLANTPSIRPTRSPWLSSSFGKRIDPIYGYWVMHKGLDMPGHIGMEVMAPADGVIIWTGWRGGYGQTVVIDHGYGLQTHFAHLSAYLVEPGMHVRRGDPVARMGSTGKSTGPHLHYEVRRLGQPMDPRRFILD